MCMLHKALKHWLQHNRQPWCLAAANCKPIQRNCRRLPCTFFTVFNFLALLSKGAWGGCIHGGASLKGEKAHFAAWKKGPESRKNEVKAPLCAAPLKHSMIFSGTFKWGGDLNGGYVFSLRQPNDAPMTQWALTLTQQTEWFEGRHVCHLCGARLRTLLPHSVAYPPLSSARY